MRGKVTEGPEAKGSRPRDEGPGARSRLVTSVPVTRIDRGGTSRSTDPVARESSVLLLVDGCVVCRLQCSPAQLEELALGFLCTVGLLPRGAGDVPVTCQPCDGETHVDVSLGVPAQDVVRLREGLVAGTSCGSGVFFSKGFDPLDCQRKVDTSFRVAPSEIADAMQAFQKTSSVYRETGGVHSAGITQAGELAAFAEDVGRHNAVDKVIGQCIRARVPLEDKVVLSTGRLSLDLVAKAVRAGLPVAASRSAPTDAAVALARLANLTLAGFVRGDRMNIYSAEWRVK